MPMSAAARDGVRAAVAWNPAGGRALLGILREFPRAVKRKDDPYGPLHLVLETDAPFRVADGRLVAPARRTHPPAMAAACERFGLEWRRGSVSRRELAAAIAVELAHGADADARDGT